MIPQFVAEAVSFKAIDESGYDWAGSDEVYAVFSDLNSKLMDLVTSQHGDVDAGETRTFGTDERCIAPRPKCDHGVSEILHFEVSFWERDERPWEFCYGDAPGLHYVLRHGKLLDALPRVGDSVERKLILGGPCGYHPPGEPGELVACGGGLTPTGPHYELTFRITRLPDVERPMVIAPPH
jgi:hypothetical protein